MSVVGPADSKKLVEALLGDLRLISTESKKKYNQVKEAAESGVVRIRNISTASSDSTLLTNLRAASSELLHPLALACGTRQSRLVQIGLQGIQRLVQHRILEPSCANVVVNELWCLVESECEELRVLQTVPPLVSADLLVTGNNLAKCIVMCFRMHFAKDTVVINAASAAVRQLVGGVFERVIQEDGVFSGDLTVVPPSGGRPSSRSAPPTLRPCAGDAYMLFKDLCLLINAEPPIWLVGIKEITRTLGLELLESLLKSYPGVFHKHSELGQLVKQEVCQLVIKLFSANFKNVHVSSQHPSSKAQQNVLGSPPDRPFFPIAMRLIRIVVVLITFYHQLLQTESEIFISHLLKFVDADKRGWQRPLALEALHRIVAKADILRWISENFDNQNSSAKLLKQIAFGVSNVIKQSFVSNQYSSDPDSNDDLNQQSGNPGFHLRGVWIPYIEHLSTKKTILLDCLERHEPSVIPEGYVVSRCCTLLADMAQNSYVAIDHMLQNDENSEANSSNVAVALALYRSVFSGLLCGFTILLNASIEETVTDLLLCGVSTLVAIGCKLKVDDCSRQSLFALCTASLPSSQYLVKFAGMTPMEQLADQGVLSEAEPSHSFHQVVATGCPCPAPAVPLEQWNQQVALSSRNLQAARALMGVITGHAQMLQNFWYLCLTACEHLAWLLNIKPSAYGLFVKDKSDSEPASSSMLVTVTNAAVAEVPVLASFMDKINFTSAILDDANFESLVDALIRLSDEQVSVAATGRECSFYPMASLLRVSLSNLTRADKFWEKVTAHFLKICAHNSATLREWAATALTTLIRQSFKIKIGSSLEAHQSMCLASLLALSDIPAPEARRKQLECLMAILQTEGAQMQPSSWGTLILIVSSVVDKAAECDENIVRQGYLGVRLISADFLQSIPFDSIGSLVEAISRYGQQLADQNISLSALALLWTISDYVFRRSESVGPDPAEKVWLVLYTCLSELCVDPRHSVRKSACQTFLQTVAAHGHALRPVTWTHMIWQIFMPLLDRVRLNTRSASNEKSTSSLIMHHSRDTEQKQWTETCINTLAAACKMFNVQRKVLLELDDFPSAWEAMLSYIEWAACYENAELSLSALKSFQELLLGRVSAQTLDMNTRDRSASNPENACNEQIPVLPQNQWLESWNSWHRIARGLAKLGSAATLPQGGLIKGSYVPGPSHLTTLLHIFPALFERVAKVLPVEELTYEQLPSVIESLVNAPVPSEQAPFIMPSMQSQLTPTQEAVLDAVRTTYNECLSVHGGLRKAIADLIRLLLRFAALALRNNPRLAPPGKNYKDWAIQCVIPFAETSLKMATDCFTTTSSFPEVIDSLVAVDLVQFLGEPLYAKYSCISSTTWKLAASSLMSVLRSSIPAARQNSEKFSTFWPVICETLEKFLFTPNTCTRLAADERKRDELTECQAIDLIRAELLSHASVIPPSAVQRLIALLNRGSICQLDPNDVLDAHTQRAELARACFDALLSTSNDGDGSLGHVAVSSLLQRCTQVMGNFVRDWSGSGDLHLPRTRLAEMVSALQAVESLINRLAKNPTLTELYSQLVSLYPTVVDVVPCGHGDPLLESQLVITLKAYQTLLLLKVVPNFTS